MLQGSTLSYSLHRTKAVGPSSPADKSQGSPAHMRSHPTATGPLPGQQLPSCRAPVTSSARGTGTMPRSGNAFTATAHQNEAQILQVPCEVTHNMNTKLLQDPLSVCTALSCRPPPSSGACNKHFSVFWDHGAPVPRIPNTPCICPSLGQYLPYLLESYLFMFNGFT